MKLLGQEEDFDSMKGYYEAKVAFSFTATRTLKVNAPSPKQAAQKLKELTDKMCDTPEGWNFPEGMFPFVDILSVGKAGGLGGYQSLDSHCEGWLKDTYKELNKLEEGDAKSSRKALV